MGEIETEVSEANFLTLFKPTGLLSLEGNVATIAAPSTMIIDLLQKRFYPLIKKAVDKHTKEDTKIVFVPRTIIKETKNQYDNSPLFEKTTTPETVVVGHLPHVRADFTFQTMAVSASNQLAYVSATTVAKKVGQAYNPLFIYGSVGVGKTHLIQAIANEVYKNDPNKIILYRTSEEFTNEVVEAIRSNDTARMKRKFRNVSLLIVDDVQFFSGKERAQEEFFHTFNALIDGGSQIVLSSDRSPSEIKGIEKRLLSRFQGGLSVDIAPPDFELRTAIVLIKARKYGVEMPIEAAKKIAEKTQDARGLEGSLLRVITESQTKDTEITERLVSQALQTEEKDFRPLHADDIIEKVCEFYRMKPTQIKSSKRNASLVRVRHILMYLLKKELSLTLVEIGNSLGGRDHTTIMHGVEKVEKLLTDKVFYEEIVGVSSYLKGGLVD